MTKNKLVPSSSSTYGSVGKFASDVGKSGGLTRKLFKERQARLVHREWLRRRLLA